MIIKEIRHKLHIFRIYIKDEPQRILFYLYHLFPVKKTKLVFSNFSGKRCGDSPFYIFQYLQKKHPDWDFVWLSDSEYNPKIPEGARSVPFGTKSKKMIYELATASVWVDSHYKPVFTKKRKNQLYIQTWHGGIGLKGDAVKDTPDNRIHLKKRFLNFEKLADYVTSDSAWFTKNFQTYFNVKDNYLEVGAPCDDIFFSKSNINEIKKSLGIPSDKNTVLYCPTFRESGDVSCYKFDKNILLATLKEKFGGDWILLVRLHPLVMNKYPDLFKADKETVFDVTKYEVVNDILMISDILITDYSGVMGTFMNTGRPQFLYQTDYETYIEERALNFENNELPFQVAKNDEELRKAILAFDNQKYKAALSHFKQKLGFVENNHATEKVCNIIENFVLTGKK
ncbi:MAG: CDP-glycerol glycerophosphotransferase family protein [Treponema sp.]|uniref:CDP-glycerol glycerophosphotransferase family protein n=1 Tax=Treponema sp. TaxID=166 RepID=UPI002A90E03D|nr:CDP-glycerol glycerophosphotransferase family protein [Treponema sp.]MDY6397569.1 CDP-glycerol glycerophosphotransferase family protein [Treponema sp.]